MKFNLNRCLIVAICLLTSTAWADSLELKNGSLINGKFIGGAAHGISFQVGSSVQKYELGDIVSLKFDSETTAITATPRSLSLRPTVAATTSTSKASKAANVTIPAGTRISVRTIDGIDQVWNVF